MQEKKKNGHIKSILWFRTVLYVMFNKWFMNCLLFSLTLALLFLIYSLCALCHLFAQFYMDMAITMIPITIKYIVKWLMIDCIISLTTATPPPPSCLYHFFSVLVERDMKCKMNTKKNIFFTFWEWCWIMIVSAQWIYVSFFMRCEYVWIAWMAIHTPGKQHSNFR